MATVYEAEDTTLNRHVAIKFLPEARKEQAVAVERFINEAQVAGRLNHPNIIAIYDIGYEHDAYYIAMELLNPGSAGHYIKRRGRMNWVEACNVVAQCCSALSSAHQAGLIHRDIKPDNILVSPAGTVKLADFGLVKELFEETSLTKSGVVVGTPLYMSPEQASAQPLDGRTDIYSLGASFYALLTGNPPYTTGSVPQIMMAHVKAPIPDPRRLAPDVPEAVVQIVRKSMAKRPGDRYQNAEEMRLALEAAVLGAERPTFSFLVAGKLSAPQRARSTNPKPRSEGIGKGGGTATTPATGDSGKSPPRTASPNPRPPTVTGETSRRTWLLGGAGLIIAGAGASALYRSMHKPVQPLDPNSNGNKPQPGSQPATAQREPIRVGVINSQAGTLSISARPVIDATLLAISEINERGGVLGRQIEAIVADGKSDNAVFAREAEKLILEKKVVTLFGGWSSSNRHSMRPIIERTGNLLMFPARDEGLEDSLNVIYCGPVPNQLVVPALRWCLANRKIERIYYMGTDGMFSHTAAEIIRDSLAAMAANSPGRDGAHDKDRPRIVGESFALLGQKNFASEIKKLVAAKPDLIFNSLIGSSNIDFLAELRAAGITPKQAPTVSFTMGENELAQIADIDVNGDYVAASYLQALPREQNIRFIDRFRKKYGDYRVVSAPMEAAYSSVYLWAQAVDQAGSTEVPAIRNALRNQSFDGPGGTVRVDPSNQHTWRPFRMGQISPEGIKIVGGDDTLIPPEPFPASRTRAEWEAFAQDLFRRWGGNWVNPDKPNPLR
jgi:urea transport system substrate-binding protein